MEKTLLEALQKEGLTFEQIQELDKRIESIENKTAVFVSHEEFWEKVAKDINTKMKEYA